MFGQYQHAKSTQAIKNASRIIFDHCAAVAFSLIVTIFAEYN
jgi:hypothetical protein